MSSLLSLLFLFLLASNSGTAALDYTKKTKRVSALRLANIQKYLQKINKPPVKSIESPDGDVIDCIRRNDQPALDHPLLKNHRVQMVAPPRPKNLDATRGASEGGARQEWNRVEHCPEGTVPVWRSTVDSVLRAKSLYHYGKKQGKVPVTLTNYTTRTSAEAPHIIRNIEREDAKANIWRDAYGAKASMSVWKPSIGEATEFSLSRISLISLKIDGSDSDINTIEAGWQVYPEIYGDSNPRLFVYWTRDGYGGTGCYNLLCPGFVQTSNKIAIGATISPVSSYSGDQFEVTILIWKDPKDGHWWMSFGGEAVGYWPKEIFTHLAEHANVVEWGGEVVNKGAGGKHTSTQMGSGHFAEEGYGRAGYFHNLLTIDSNNSLVDAVSVATIADKRNCYSIKSSRSKQAGTYFFYGGPGSNPKCP